MIRDHIILSILWLVYCLLHSVLASLSVKTRLKKFMGENYKVYRVIYTIFFLIFLILILWFQISIRSKKLIEPLLLIQWIGIIISLSGLVLMILCIKKYFFSLSGLKSLIRENVTGQLIISGIHKHIRHPLYLGTFAFIWGLFLVFPYWSLFLPNIIITIYTLIGISLEEKKLIAEFGDQYRLYRKRVPKLIPFLKPKRQS